MVFSSTAPNRREKNYGMGLGQGMVSLHFPSPRKIVNLDTKLIVYILFALHMHPTVEVLFKQRIVELGGKVWLMQWSRIFSWSRMIIFSGAIPCLSMPYREGGLFKGVSLFLYVDCRGIAKLSFMFIYLFIFPFYLYYSAHSSFLI